MEKTNKFVDPMDKLLTPPKRTRWEAFKLFLYNPEKGAILGRTPSSWAKITTFYIIFYSCLAGFFAVCIWGLLQTIDDNRPTYQLDESLIGSSPGLSSRPIAPEGRESVMTFNLNSNSWQNSDWPELLGDFLEEYNTTMGNNCDFGNQNELPCNVNTDNWGACKPDGRQINAACIYFKINKVLEWKPSCYTDENNLPSEMPQSLKEKIAKTDQDKRNMVWLSCEGRYSVDKERLRNVTLYPLDGFPDYYFPFRRQNEYKSPVVAVHFENPEPGHTIDVECRSWAHNIHQDRQNQLAVLSFKLRFNN